jgi:hypothetical protein
MNTTPNKIGLNVLKFLDQDVQVNGILEAALKVGIFEALKDDFLTISQIREKCGLKMKERNLFDLLDILYLNQHLLREGNEISSVKYKNAHNYLVKENPDNLIPIVGMKDRFIRRFRDLPYMMKENQNPEGAATFVEIFSNEQHAKDFMWTMALLQHDNFETLAKGINLTPYKSVVDIGGCLGAFCMHVKKHNPHLSCLSLDLPFVEPFARQYLTERKMLDQIQLKSGDMFSEEPFPQCDVLAMGNILHDWNDEKKRLLMKKAYDSLSEGGIMIVVELFLKNERDAYDAALSMSFHMLLECIDGFNMSRQEMENYSKEAGFKQVKFLFEELGVDAAILYK